MIDVQEYGVYVAGMNREEIVEYLVARYNEKTTKNQNSYYINTKRLIKKFAQVAGANTQAMITCPCCKKQISLMYRHDVKRFADQMFDGTPTFWD